MLWDVHGQHELFARIDRWQKEVVTDTLLVPHRMNLRPRAIRPALAEVSENPRPRKRKMPDSTAIKSGKRSARNKDADNVGSTDGATSENAPRRGRSSKPRDQERVECPDYLDLQIRPTPPSSIWSPSGPSSPRKAGTSPSKKHVTLDKQISEAAIDMEYLKLCDPATHLTKFQDLRLDGTNVPPAVEELFDQLEGIPQGLIPSALEPLYEEDASTPRKSKVPLPKMHYLEAGKTPFPLRCLDRMKSTADNVLRKASRAQSEKAHEKQWDALINQLLCEVEIWQKLPEQVIVLNVETCSIEPFEIRSRRPDGPRIEYDAQTVSSDAKTKTPSEDLVRMVDWCLGMTVEKSDMAQIQKAYARAEPYAASLNQSLAYIKRHPLILDIEVKKPLQSRDPQVQLAIWASSALLKKRLHGWDTSMPMPAVAIDGHVWAYYIFFEQKNDLMMAGPYPFGSTETLNGIWTIFYRLHIIMEWGMTKYRDWFKANVVESARRFAEM